MSDGYEHTRKPRENRVVRESHLDFLYELHNKGLELTQDQKALLIQYGRIKPTPIPESEIPEFETDKIHDKGFTQNQNQLDTDKNVDIIYGEEPHQFIITDHELEERRKKGNYIFEGRKEPITKKEWLPKDTDLFRDHEPEFVQWIDSINGLGFQNKTHYRKFNLYVQQAYTWLAEKKSYLDFSNEDDREEFIQEELRRCKENGIYFLNKYVYYQEGSADSGEFKYTSFPAHEVMSYLNDCGYSIGLIKGRQMAATTTFMALDVRDMIFKKNHFMKFVTEDQEKAEEIFDDKLKYCFAQLPYWMKPEVANERDNYFKLGKKDSKGDKSGVNSRIRVVPPKRTAIAGGAPQKVKIDEAGNIAKLSEMISNARPTMFMYDPKLKKMVRKRQLIFYGCVCAGTKVWNNNGKLVNIEDLKKSHGILGYNGKNVSKEPIIWMKPPEKKPCYRLTVTGGDFIECSEDHPLMWGKLDWKTSYNRKLITFKRADEIKKDDHLLMIGSVPVFGKKSIKYARLLGLMIGDGNYGATSMPEMYCAEKEIIEYLEKNYETSTYKKFILSNGNDFKKIGIKKFLPTLRKHKMLGQTKNNKRLPFDIDTFDKKSISEIIGGYFDADGNVNYSKLKNKIRVVLTSTCVELLTEVKYQLIKFGIGCSITKENRNENGSKISKGQQNHIFRLYINTQSDVIKFHKEIKLLCDHKQKALDQILIIKHVKKEHSNIKSGQFVPPESGKGAHFIGNKNMTGLKYKRVTKVEFIGEKEIYNLNAGKTHTYLANGFVTANTGGEQEKGGMALQVEWMALNKQWKERNFKAGVIPIFFNWWARPGATKELYDDEKSVAYSKEGPELKKSIVEFHQSWPNTISDVFMTSEKTLVGTDYIDERLDYIKSENVKHKHQMFQRGYFEPVYDETKQADEHDDVPYKIIGSNFIPVGDADPRASVIILFHPQRSWKNRYFQGTDPIASDTGQSNMSGAIWDKHLKTISAIMNFRTRDYRYTFLQHVLLNIYYDTSNDKRGAKELLESNIGQSYSQYKIAKGYGDSFVLNYELPPYLQNKTTINEGIGFDNKGHRNEDAVNILHQMIKTFGERILIEVFWDQLKTFVYEVSGTGKNMWGPANRKFFKDDTLFSCVYSYICGELCYPELIPVNTEEDYKRADIVTYELIYDKDYNLIRVPIRKKVGRAA